MANIIRVLFDRLITWLDFPPPQPKVGVADVNWEFLGDILGELATLSQKEIQDFAQQDFLTENEIKSLIATWVTPVFNRLTSESQQKVIASLDYYLCTDSDKINWVFPSFNIPLRIISHKAFFKLIRETLTNSPLPKSINTSLFHENNHRSFTNTLFSNLKRNALTTSSPIRKGLILPKDLNIYDANTSLETLKKWASSGIYPNNIKGLPVDAARWLKNIDVESIYQLASSRFLKQKNDNLGVFRITLVFSHPVGEGFLAHHPDKLVTTHKVRAFVSHLGFLTHCYPCLR